MLAASKKIVVKKNEWGEYKNLLDYLAHPKSKMEKKFIVSDDFEEITNYLDK
ncbi:hypothetical protein KKF38_01365 [Patescibacteria group bacterium]|nr:hypothetical protein [Patescibacteria group bacterium]